MRELRANSSVPHAREFTAQVDPFVHHVEGRASCGWFGSVTRMAARSEDEERVFGIKTIRRDIASGDAGRGAREPSEFPRCLGPRS